MSLRGARPVLERSAGHTTAGHQDSCCCHDQKLSCKASGFTCTKACQLPEHDRKNEAVSKLSHHLDIAAREVRNRCTSCHSRVLSMGSADAAAPLLDGDEESPHGATVAVTHRGILREWVLLGWTAFGGPAAHVGIFRKVPDPLPRPHPAKEGIPAVSVVIETVPALVTITFCASCVWPTFSLHRGRLPKQKAQASVLLLRLCA
jgi:hypothetical protein